MDDLWNILERFDGKRVLVVGDLMVDEHIWGNVNRVSPEAPVLVVDVDGDSELRPGGAGNVAVNLQALGGEVAVVGVVGQDAYGQELMKSLSSAGIDTSGIITDSERVTTRKTRVWVSHRQQVVRIDRESSEPVNQAITEVIIGFIQTILPECDALIMSDYNKGLFTTESAARSIALAGKMKKLCTANPKPANLIGFRGAELVVLNCSEAEAAAHVRFDNDDSLIEAGRTILSDLGPGCLVITRGASGLTVFCKSGETTVPAVKSEVYDVAGAGDTVISAITLALAVGAGHVHAAQIGNFAGGAAVRKVGVCAVTRDEIRSAAGLCR